MTIFAAISHLAEEYSRARTRYQTERLLRSLPFEVQKDIGWPQVDDSRRVTGSFTKH